MEEDLGWVREGGGGEMRDERDKDGDSSEPLLSGDKRRR